MYESFSRDFEDFSNSWWPYIIALVISFILAVRVYVGGAQYQSSYRIEGKVVIITGGARGIGFETAKNLAARGGQLILAVRNMEQGIRALDKIKETIKTAEITVKWLDISDFSSIRHFVDQIFSEHDKVDILINNAAVVYQPYMKTVDGNEHTVATNYLGPFLLTHLLLPLLNRSDNGRIINISAIAHYNGRLKPGDLTANTKEIFDEKSAFAQSKLALTIFTKCLATLLKGTKITCNSVSPGLVRSTGHLKNLPLHRSLWSKLAIWPWMWLFLKTPKQGCQSIVYLAVDPSLRDVSGFYFSDCEIKEPADLVKDVSLAHILYRTSCKIVDIDGTIMVKRVVNEAGNNSDDFF
ncbi:retinol dehydrogenase 13-like [Euwallacea similis]|uniref:retinol dehydrogenase 13-like n=1 Tax=Euwallacea similis TaxID=1736056 RepID=UPI00344CD6E9